MGIKGGNFIESYIEKLVLAGVGVVCIYVLISYVVVSPIKVPLGSRDYEPDEIDNVIAERAELLENNLTREPEQKEQYDPKADAFLAMIEGRRTASDRPFVESFPLIAKDYLPYAIGNIVSNYVLPMPPEISNEQTLNKKYRLPEIGTVTDVSVEHIRAAAYVPVSKVDLDNQYEQNNSDVNDIDLVTVAAKFDVPQLVKEFHSCFDGPGVPPAWRDPRLAKPVFAAVELQRREELPHGSWSDWEVVPRTKVDPYKQSFKLNENAQELPPGGVKMLMLQFDDEQLRRFLLQPLTYEIASAEEEWFPPPIHREFLDYQRDIARKERLEARKKQREEKENENTYGPGYRTRPGERGFERYDRRTPGGRPGSGRYTRPGTPRYSGRLERGPFDNRRGRYPDEKQGPSKKKKESETKSIDDYYQKLEEVQIPDDKDVTGLDKPVLFWANDDTLQPGKTYQYRIRLGVFNPVAGTDQVKQAYNSKADQIVLWSSFSELTDKVDIPKMMYFFPSNIQKAAQRVTVKVSKYILGYWYSKNFAVKPGESIGEVVKHEPEQEQEQNKWETKKLTGPERINYSTGAVFVDVSLVNSWAKSGTTLDQSYYADMLYSYDGINIEHMPIKYRYWPYETQNMFRDIQDAEKKEKKALRGWGGRSKYGSGVSYRGSGRKGTGKPKSREDSEKEAFERMMNKINRGR